MNIGFATRDWSSSWTDPSGQPVIGGAGHYRMALPAIALRQAGHQVLVGTLGGPSREGELGIRTISGEAFLGFDVIVMQRFMNEGIDIAIRRARALGQVVLNDVDDWWDGLDPGNAAFWATSPASSPRENRIHYRKNLAASDALICSTPFLAKRMERLAPTRLIRNRIDFARWNASKPPDGPLTVGWVGATPWRSAGDLESLRGVLGPFLERADGRLYHGGYRWGDQPVAERMGVDPRRSLYAPMTTVDDYPTLFDGFHIGIVPLADKPFNEAKSAIKGMEYAAAGIPFIAQATGEYTWLAAHERIGRIAHRPRDWIRHLETLREMGEQGCREEAAIQSIRVAGLDAAGLVPEWEQALWDLGVMKVALA